MSVPITESVVEEAALAWVEGMGYTVLPGPKIAPGELTAERAEYDEVVLAGRLQDAIERLNPDVPAEGREDAFRKVTRVAAPSLVSANRAFHQMLVEGVDVEYQGEGLAARQPRADNRAGKSEVPSDVLPVTMVAVAVAFRISQACPSCFNGGLQRSS